MLSQSGCHGSDSGAVERKYSIHEMAFLQFEKSISILKKNLNSQICVDFIFPIRAFISDRNLFRTGTDRPSKSNESQSEQRPFLRFLSNVGSHLPHDMKDMNGIPLAAFITLVYSSFGIDDTTFCSKEFVQQANELCKEEPLSASLLILAVLFCSDSFSLFENALCTIISAEIDVNETFPYNHLNNFCINYFSGIKKPPPNLLGEEQSALSVAISCGYDEEAKLLLRNGISSRHLRKVIFELLCLSHSSL